MGSIVTSKRVQRSWMYTNGTFQVLFSCAFHSGAGLKDAPHIAADLFPIIADTLCEWWPLEYRHCTGGALAYLDLDKYSAGELLKLEQAVQTGIDEIESGRFDRVPIWTPVIRANLTRVGKELLDLIRAAIGSAPTE